MKTCSCGKEYIVAPETAQYHADVCPPGWYWNCSCRSTLYSPRKYMVDGTLNREEKTYFFMAAALWLLVNLIFTVIFSLKH